MHEIENGARTNLLDLPEELETALAEVGTSLPDWEMNGTFLSGRTIQQYRAALDAAPEFRGLKNAAMSALSSEGGGYAVVRLGGIAQALGVEGEPFLRLVTAILAHVAIPFQPFLRWPLWKALGTNLDAKPGMSTGIGHNAWHIDLVNATQPPDYSVLLCVRPDPLGAGESIVSDARAAVSRLSESVRALLADQEYRYGSFYGLSDVGEEFTPFPILDGERDDKGFVRFTAKMLADGEFSKAHTFAAQELADELSAGQVAFTLQRGDLLIVNQHQVVHGRLPLADGQESVPAGDRRLLQQLFLRSPQQV
ncbi:TauD/TfdA family dioxygenase [Kitasatospora sp. NPDC059646]|uniref:TauD/TfdA family dioxygenase n=1 Tax=Kitasatospora sp. NPDC059646 TaxID=3346893 RepID=UPI0036ACCA4B